MEIMSRFPPFIGLNRNGGSLEAPLSKRDHPQNSPPIGEPQAMRTVALTTPDTRALSRELRHHQTRRKLCIETQRTANQRLDAFTARSLMMLMPEDNRPFKQILKTATAIRAHHEKGPLAEDGTRLPLILEGYEDVQAKVADFLEIHRQSRLPWDSQRKTIEKQMTVLAGQLPVAPFVRPIHGMGMLGLAIIAAESWSLKGDMTLTTPPGAMQGRSWCVIFGASGGPWHAGESSPRRLIDYRTSAPTSGEGTDLHIGSRQWIPRPEGAPRSSVVCRGRLGQICSGFAIQFFTLALRFCVIGP